jgi:hypothetical protein
MLCYISSDSWLGVFKTFSDEMEVRRVLTLGVGIFCISPYFDHIVLMLIVMKLNEPQMHSLTVLIYYFKLSTLV